MELAELVTTSFFRRKISIRDIEIRNYPNETIAIVYVDPSQFADAGNAANEIDAELAATGFKGFITIRKADAAASRPAPRITSLDDARVNELVNLLTSRARTNLVQPSLSYIPDAHNNISLAVSARHHLIFGRRGAGKTSLLAEVKTRIEKEGNLTAWVNLQSLRHETTERIFMLICQHLINPIEGRIAQMPRVPSFATKIVDINRELDLRLSRTRVRRTEVARLVPQTNSIIKRSLELFGVHFFIFVDDFHYLPRKDQPWVLDLLHGCVRDADAWLKVASIEHLSRWYDPELHLGLETGHDASTIDLDLTLHEPSKAKDFLEKVLKGYANHCGITSLSHIYSTGGALDRLVLASGAVPRDYLSTSANAIKQAQKRQNARVVGVQDVNKAAADAKQRKLDELEEDAAAEQGQSAKILRMFQLLRKFCVEDKAWTMFRVDFADKDRNPAIYGVLQELSDLRLIHLVDPSLSDEHRAGHRSEVYMLDVSQYVGHRLKRKLKLLDLRDGHFVLKDTGGDRDEQIGNTPNKRLALFRRAPLVRLDDLSEALSSTD
jgi:hypothetical protein